MQKLAPFTQLLGAKKGRENSNLGPFWEHRFCAHFVLWLRHGSCRQVGHKIPILGQCLGTLQPLTELDFVQIWQFYGHFRAICSALTPTAISRVPWVLDPRFLFRHVGGWCFYHSKKIGYQVSLQIWDIEENVRFLDFRVFPLSTPSTQYFPKVSSISR